MEFNIYEEITNNVIEQLESGQIPWVKSWNGGGAYNRISKKYYSFMNNMLLGGGEWATFKQWQNLGGKVRKCEKGKMIVFWKVCESKTEKDTDGNPIKFPVLKYSTVFNVSQVDGVEPLGLENIDIKPIESIEQTLQAYRDENGIKFSQCHCDSASFSPATHRVKLPLTEQFIGIEEYYSVSFHEHIHSTGSSNILNRKIENEFGTQDYAREELTAEIGAASRCYRFGVDTGKTNKNSIAYLQSWIRKLKNDSKALIVAAGKAEKAVNYIIDYATESPLGEEPQAEAI